MKRFISVIFVLVVVTAMLGLARQSQAAPVQSTLSWVDTFTDKAGLYTLSDTDVVDGSGALTLAHAISDPSLYKSSGEAVSEIINPLVKKIQVPQPFSQVTEGKNGFLYMSNLGDLYSYQLATGEIMKTSVSFLDQSITSMTTTSDGNIFMGVSTLTDTLDCPVHCRYGTGKIWSYNPTSGGLEDYGVPLIDTAAISVMASGPSDLIYGIANIWSTSTKQTPHLFYFTQANPNIIDLGSISTAQDTFDTYNKTLTIASNGKVYFESLVSGVGHLIEYNPVGNIFSDKGYIQGQGRLNSLSVDANSQVYGGTNNYYNGGLGVFFAYNNNKFQVIPSDDFNRGVYAVTAGKDGNIYGALRRGWVPYLFAYNTITGNYFETGRVNAGMDDIGRAVWASNGQVYAFSNYLPNMYVFSPAVNLTGWDKLYFNPTTPAGTFVKVDVLDANGSVLLSDVPNGVSLAGLNPSLYRSLQLRARLGGSGLVTPSLNSWTITWNVSGKVSSISGRVAGPNNLPFQNVAVSLNDSSSAATTPDGMFTFNNLLPDSYTLIPSLAGYSFWPPTRTVTLPPSAAYLNFTILASAVSANVTPGPGSPVDLTYNDTQGLPTGLLISPDAVTDPTTFTMTPTLAASGAGFAFTGHAFEISAFPNNIYQPNYVFQEPVLLTVEYSDWDVRCVQDVRQLTIRWWNGSQWQDAVNTCIPAATYTRDIVGHTISLPICHLSKYGLFGNTNQVLLPVVTR